MEQQQLSAQEYADTLRISKQAVCKKIRDGKLPEGVTAIKVGTNYVITIHKRKRRKK